MTRGRPPVLDPASVAPRIGAGYPEPLRTKVGPQVLDTGMCAGFPAGAADAHCLVNEGTQDVVYLEVGDRTPGEVCHYPDDDVAASAGQAWTYTRKDGSKL